ncbi:MAG: pirin family protein [Jatrophihabitantaceae bacterium]
MSSYDLRRAGDRPRTETGWLHSAHSFSFGPHYQADNLSFGPLIAHNEDLLQAGPGYPLHWHRDTEILTWLIEGTLLHVDADGQQHRLRPGMLQLISAGSGIEHTERSAWPDQPVRLVQMWLRPAEAGRTPSYAQADFSDQLAGGELVTVASGAPVPTRSALPVGSPGAVLAVARLRPGRPLPLPAADRLHLFVCSGSLQFGPDAVLQAGDAVRIAGRQAETILARQPAEVLVWQFADERG